MKTFSLISNGTVHDIKLGVSFYEMGGNLGIRMIKLNGKIQKEPWSTLTINFLKEPMCEKDCSYIDVYKNGREILEWIAKNKLAMPTGRISNAFGYPEYRFNPYILAKADPKGYAVYLLSRGYGIAQRQK